MAYDDGYYYGQCKIVCEAEDTIDNGKTVSIVSGEKSWSKAIANKTAEFLVPGRDRYTVSLLDGEVTKWSGIIEAGYGECIHVMLADGYTPVIKKDFDAQLTTSNGVPFRFGYDAERDRYGYIRNIGGADTVIPFTSSFSFKLKDNGMGTGTVDVKQYLIDNHFDDIIDYTKLSNEDFILQIATMYSVGDRSEARRASGNPGSSWSDRSYGAPTLSYNAQTGILSITVGDNTSTTGSWDGEFYKDGGYFNVYFYGRSRIDATVIPWLVIQRPL